MFKSYFKTAARNLWKNKTFTLLNMGGLTISLTACLVIFFWVSDEMNYDRVGANADRIFRAALVLKAKDQPDKLFAVTAPPLAPTLIKDFPEIEKAVRIEPANVLVTYNNERFFCDKFLFADPSFFEVFGYPLLKGNPAAVLNGTNAAVISESMAKRLFGSVYGAMGKTIMRGDTIPLIVNGVAKDLPANNHFHFDIVSSIKIPANDAYAWWNDDYYTYILLKNAADAPAVENKMANIMDKYNAKQNKELGFTGVHFLQPVKSIHLHSDLRAEIAPNGNITSLRIFIGIAIFLLIVTCINYINLTTATSFKRAKEIGMRKITGAAFSQLVAQFLSESVLISVIALLCSIGLGFAAVPFFNSIAKTQIVLSEHLSVAFILQLIVSAILLGITAGIYPALYLSKIRPLIAFKKMHGISSGSLSLRKILVVFQFSLSNMLIIATIIALQQLHYMQSQSLGFNKQQVVAIPLRNNAEQSKEVIIKEFEKVAGVTEACSSSSTPGKGLSNIVVLPEGVAEDHLQTMNTLVVDYGFIGTYGLTMAAGRAFNKEYGGDSMAFILNETAVRELGWGAPKNAIGKGFNWGLGKKGKIIGVVKDFHFKSLQQKTPPIVMQLNNPGWYNYISVKINAQNTKQVISSLQNRWKAVLPGNPFDYFFVDEDYDKQYQTEQILSNISVLFSVLIIFISCLGLLGLVIVAVSQRVKEIGIRKVLGSSVAGIITLMSKDFIRLVFIAIVIATPVAWWMMNKWLAGFAYRVQPGWWVFATAALLTVFIALATISYQAIKAAVANPVRALRSE